jgi:hypothetical protein
MDRHPEQGTDEIYMGNATEEQYIAYQWRAGDFLQFATEQGVRLTAYQRLAINKIMSRAETYGLFFGENRMDAINLLLKYVDERAKR